MVPPQSNSWFLDLTGLTALESIFLSIFQKPERHTLNRKTKEKKDIIWEISLPLPNILVLLSIFPLSVYSEVLLRSYEGHNPGSPKLVLEKLPNKSFSFPTTIAIFITPTTWANSPLYVAGAEEWCLSKTLGVPAEIFFSNIYALDLESFFMRFYSVVFMLTSVAFFYYSEFAVFLLRMLMDKRFFSHCVFWLTNYYQKRMSSIRTDWICSLYIGDIGNQCRSQIISSVTYDLNLLNNKCPFSWFLLNIKYKLNNLPHSFCRLVWTFYVGRSLDREEQSQSGRNTCDVTVPSLSTLTTHFLSQSLHLPLLPSWICLSFSLKLPQIIIECPLYLSLC